MVDLPQQLAMALPVRRIVRVMLLTHDGFFIFEVFADMADQIVEGGADEGGVVLASGINEALEQIDELAMLPVDARVADRQAVGPCDGGRCHMVRDPLPWLRPPYKKEGPRGRRPFGSG